MDISPIVGPLNDSQRQAVTADPGNILVLAGAGSGKTRVLVHRIAWLIQMEGINPQRILAVTFTNKAANEMRLRIEEMLEHPVGGMWVGTFHSLAHRLLRRHWQEAGLPEKFQILDADDQLRLIRRLHQGLNLDDNQWPVKQCQSYINQQKDEGLRTSNIEHYDQEFAEVMLKVYRAYEQVCERDGLVDFGELLLRCHELLLKNAGLLQHYQHRFPHILVDEFQDTNKIQYAWLRVLAGKGGCLAVVGDDDQSIYGWRGAKIENILSFEKDFPAVRVVRLEQNYRSTATILKAANSLIANNRGRLGKSLWTEGDEGEKISRYSAFNEKDEAWFICRRLEEWIAAGRKRTEAAVLYRANAQSRELEEALLSAGIPYRVYGGFRFYERQEIRNAMAYLRLLASRADDAAFERVVNVPTRGIGASSMERLRELAGAEGSSLWQAAAQAVEKSLLPTRIGLNLSAFLRLIDGMEKAARGKTLGELTDHVIQGSGLLRHHEKEGGEKARIRIENLQELVSATSAYETEEYESPEAAEMAAEGAAPPGETGAEAGKDAEMDGQEWPAVEQIPASASLEVLAGFLDKVALDAGDRRADGDEDAVQLMTLHSAKGLEFPLVFIAGMEEGLFPHSMSMDDLAGLEEERRLCYVGLTRAMQKLYLCHAESRRLHGRESWTRPSRFLAEIPDELLDDLSVGGQVRSSWAVRPGRDFAKASRRQVHHDIISALDGAAEAGDAAICLGQRVKHPKFGEGIVLNCEGRGNNARVQVDFDRAGSKWLALAYARLQGI